MGNSSLLSQWVFDGTYIYPKNASTLKIDALGRISQTGLGGSTFFGYLAGIDDDLSNNLNTAIGYQALYKTTTGTNNVALGYKTLLDNLTGNYNIAIGSSAQENTTASDNLAIGYQSLYLNSSGERNVALGNYTLADNSTGNQNVAVGNSAMENNIDGFSNTAIGYLALFTPTSANYNLAIGQETLYSTTTGHHNTAIGNLAIKFNTTGHYNTGIGYNALYSNSTGSGNVAIGYYAGKYELGSDSFYINNQDRTNTATEKTNSLMYGVMAATAAAQDLTINADVGIGVQTPDISFQLKNNEWIGFKDYAGTSALNTFKGNTDDEVDVGVQLNIGELVGAADTWQTLWDMPVSSDLTAGDKIGGVIKIDGINVLEINAEADGSGGIQNQSIKKNGGQFNSVTTVAAATYDLLATDYILKVTYTATGAVTSLTLPTAQCVEGRTIIIKDTGNAGTNNITIDSVDNIDGAGTYVINGDYNSVKLCSDGTTWYAI